MDPAVETDLVPAIDDTPRLIRIDQRGNRGDEESGGYAVAGKDAQDSWNAYAPPEFSPGKAPDGTATAAEFGGLMIAIKRKRYGTAGSVTPGIRPQRRPGTNPAQEPPPMLFGPLIGRDLAMDVAAIHYTTPQTRD